jgi:C4-dicarboxylate-specific signal transduction histidine kinase
LVYAEGELLELLLANLVVNAAESMSKPGKIIVSIVKSGSMAEVRITDSGSGISPAVRDRLFEPFFSTKANGKGIGLGLHVSQIIANRHGATLRIASLQPVGTAVTVRFQLAPV